ncbi:hypothetical protein TWF281_011588 [Arthrobotrys megalospora]
MKSVKIILLVLLTGSFNLCTSATPLPAADPSLATVEGQPELVIKPVKRGVYATAHSSFAPGLHARKPQQLLQELRLYWVAFRMQPGDIWMSQLLLVLNLQYLHAASWS